MYQVTINPNASTSLPASPPPFIPPNYAIWVNALWFLSLVISITCALLATLLQQWARRYLKVTQPRYSPHKRAQIRAFFAEGVEKFLLPWAVEALPTMLHLSLFLFFAGLAVFLWNVNLTIFKLVLSWISLCTALYGCITFIPVFCHDSPYHTPLSLPVWHFVTGIRFLTFRALERVITLSSDFRYETYVRFERLAEGYGVLLERGMRKAAEETAFNSPPEIDTRAFMWVFDCLDEDHELESFFAGLPGFRGSRMVKDPLPDLILEQQEKLLDALIGLLDRTYSSDLLAEQAKIRRTTICRKAIGSADIPSATWQRQALRRITSEDQYGPVQSAEVACLLRSWDNGEDEEITMINRAIVSSVVARAQRHDDLWFTMASDEMSVSESVLRNHATNGNNLSLAILNHAVRQHFGFFEQQHWPLHVFSNVLEAASRFDVLDTSPELQHEFCELWNQVVRAAKLGMPWDILRRIRNVYLMLHLHTDCAPTEFSASTGNENDILWLQSTYPLCSILSHHPNSTPHIHDVSASASVFHSVPNDNDALVPSSLTDTASTLSSSLTTSVHVVANEVDVPMFYNTLVPPPSSHAHQATTDNLHDSATSSDPAAGAATVTPQNNAGLLEHSDEPEIPPLASPELVLDNITGPSLSPTLTFATHRLS